METTPRGTERRRRAVQADQLQHQPRDRSAASRLDPTVRRGVVLDSGVELSIAELSIAELGARDGGQ